MPLKLRAPSLLAACRPSRRSIIRHKSACLRSLQHQPPPQDDVPADVVGPEEDIAMGAVVPAQDSRDGFPGKEPGPVSVIAGGAFMHEAGTHCSQRVTAEHECHGKLSSWALPSHWGRLRPPLDGLR